VNRINAAAVARSAAFASTKRSRRAIAAARPALLTIALHTAAETSHASATVIHTASSRGCLEFDGIDIEDAAPKAIYSSAAIWTCRA